MKVHHGHVASALPSPAVRRPADHRRLRAAPGALHVHGAAGLPATLHLHDLSLDASTAHPSRDRADLRHRRRRDRSLLSLDHRLLGIRLRSLVQGIRSRLARRPCGPRLRTNRRTVERLPRRQDRHSILHGDPRHPVLLGGDGNGPFRRQVLCASRRRGEFGLAVDCRTPFRRLGDHLDRTGSDPVAVDSDHRCFPVVHP